MKPHLFLYGPPDARKSTLGRNLAERLGLSCADLGERAGQEAAALQQAVAAPASVIVLGDGALLDAASRDLAEHHGRILLLETEANGHHAAHYASFPTRLRLADDSPEAVLDRAQILLGRFRVTGMGHPYDVCVRADLLAELGPLLAARGCRGRMLVVGDTHTDALFGGPAAASLTSAGFHAARLAIPAGEAHKQIGTVNSIWRACLAAGIDRGDTIIAIGGGVTGDLAGFAAATWLRGIRWVVAPTTLLAMVDSSLGGKTGADLPEGKNLIGAFHPPALVLADTSTLASLPDEEFRAGLAEVVKHGIIADPELFELCRIGFQGLRQAAHPEFVSRAMAVKVRTIALDPFETGIRAALNLGHTIGHGIEQAMGFRLRHGEAVAIGLVSEARIAEQLGLAQPGLADDVAGVLSGLGLPTGMPHGLDRAACLAAIRLDKKRKGGIVRFALPLRVGAVQTGVSVDEAGIAAAIR